MKKIISIFGMMVFLMVSSLSVTFGQIIHDDIHIINPGTDQPGGGYAGYPGTGQVSFRFYHENQFGVITPGAIKIQVNIPGGTHFDSTLASYHPGWSLEVTSPISASLYNTDTIPPFYTTGWLSDSFNLSFVIDTQLTHQPMTITAAYTLEGSFSYDYATTQDDPTIMYLTVAGTPLPVDFASFDAKAAGCAVALNWVTSREENNDYFVVERSQDGRYFSKVGSVKALSGEDVGNREYSFVDEHPFQGNNFYRIHQMDINGKSTTTSVEKVQLSCDFNGDISVYPNPTRGIVYVKGLADAESIEVFNVLGQRVLTQKVKQGTEVLDISSLADGNYHLRVIRNQESIFSAKIVKK